VAAYRLSVQAGNPLSERRLAQIFGRTSRRWARARIAEARQASPPPDPPDRAGPGVPGYSASRSQSAPGPGSPSPAPDGNIHDLRAPMA
jgi:hypothetical protein